MTIAIIAACFVVYLTTFVRCFARNEYKYHIRTYGGASGEALVAILLVGVFCAWVIVPIMLLDTVTKKIKHKKRKPLLTSETAWKIVIGKKHMQ